MDALLAEGAASSRRSSFGGAEAEAAGGGEAGGGGVAAAALIALEGEAARVAARREEVAASMKTIEGMVEDAHTRSWDAGLGASSALSGGSLSAREIRCCRACNQGRLAASSLCGRGRAPPGSSTFRCALPCRRCSAGWCGCSGGGASRAARGRGAAPRG